MAEVGLKDEVNPRGLGEPGLVTIGLSTNREKMSDRLVRWLWHDRSIRWQLLATFLLINLVAGIAAAISVIYNAQRATEVEIAATMEVAERFVRGNVERLVQATYSDPSLENLRLHISNLRHVRIQILDAKGHPVSLLPAANGIGEAEEESEVPRWFAALIKVDDLRREVPVTSGIHNIGTVVLEGEASDEVAEVWQDISDLALVALVLNFTMIGVFYFALGRVLRPLTNVATGLRELEEGRFRHRLPRPKVRELAAIVERLNALADRLDAAKADNARLNRRLITVQDDERRQIAMELHDELGPCLFGIRSKVGSLERLATRVSGDVADRIRERVATLVEITDKIQATNRDLLRKLRPMALGHVALADVIASLVADFERHGASCSVSLEIGRLARSYGDCIDLTVYRCIQEGIINSMQHAQARGITVKLDERAIAPVNGSTSPASAELLCTVRDDGRGIPPGTLPGFGLIGIEERVRAIGGSFSVASQPGGGTRLDISLPLDEPEQLGSGSALHSSVGAP